MALIVVAMPGGDRRAAVVAGLIDRHHTVVEVSTADDAIRRVFDEKPDAILLGLASSEDFEGLPLVRMLRAASDLPIIALTRADDPETSVQALDFGADDVAHESASVEECVARVSAAIRRHMRLGATIPDRTVVRTGDIVIDRAAQIVTKRGEHIRLTRTEYRLLDALASRAGQVAPHRYLLSAVWGDAFSDETHYLRIYIGYLRAKLEDDPHQPRYLANEWGLGYRLVVVSPQPSPTPRPRSEPEMEPRASQAEDHDVAPAGPLHPADQGD